MVVVFALVLTLCLITWYAIAKTIGLRVSAEAEAAGLDISEHGMYGYPEQFISDAELYGPAVPASVKLNGHAPATRRPGPLRLRRPDLRPAVLLGHLVGAAWTGRRPPTEAARRHDARP